MKELTQKIKYFSVAFLLLLVSAELWARFVWGLGDPVLYEASSIYGYRPQPNQDIRRLGNRIFYNAQGLRSEPMTSIQPLPGTVRILCIGDSITFGGVQTDQAETYPYQLQKLLNQQSSVPFEVLNASAAGWAIKNEEAYLRQKGIYGSQIVVLQLGSHDLYQQKSSSELVGRSPVFPDRKPLLGLEEGFFRYFLPRFLFDLQLDEPNLQPAHKNKLAEAKKDVNRNIASFVRIANIVKSMQAQLVLILVQQPDELEPKNAGATYAKEMLAIKARELGVPYKNLQEDFRLNGGYKLFRDGLHPNPEGNKVIAEAIAKLLESNPPVKVRQLSQQ